jgi:2-polyprenyl-6-methoxyphenol hydroxylase-like FAD-dependent oxidoreductase
MEAILGAAKDPVDAGHVNFVTRLSGDLIGRLPFEKQGDDCFAYTPTPLRNLSQHRFEPILARSFENREHTSLEYGLQWESSAEDESGVHSVLRNLETGETVEVHSRYVVAADGAGSRVRTSLGIEMQGPPRIQSFLMIHVEANLRAFVADRLGVLHFVMDPEASGTFIAHDLDREWVFMQSFDPDNESEDDFDEASTGRGARSRRPRLPGRRCRSPFPADGWVGVEHGNAGYPRARMETGRGRSRLGGTRASRYPRVGENPGRA